MKKRCLPVIGFLALACQFSGAQTPLSLKDAAQAAIASNPEVTARLNAFRAAGEDSRVAGAAFRPRVDLTAGVEAINRRSSISGTDSYSSAGGALTVTQLLWDGLGTKSQEQRLGHARLVRYFEFIDASEQTALEAARAYADVERARRLLKLAEDNYVSHKVFADQIGERTKSGLNPDSDGQQANARLALAQSNLLTERANLHDVTERFRRIVGALPPSASSGVEALSNGLPTNGVSFLEQSVRRHAGVAAAVENLRAAQAQSNERQASLKPRVEARLRGAVGHNADGVLNQSRDARAGVYLNWNLYDGGADQARVRQTANLLAQAADTRDKVCRDARQNAAIAFQDVERLGQQLPFLQKNEAATLLARDAYRLQFNVARKTLLDVLNTENEYYTARRAVVNAESDLIVARARTHASGGTLVATLGLTRAGTVDDIASEATDWRADGDAATRCPIDPTDVGFTSSEDLDARARAVQRDLPPPATPSLGTPPAGRPTSQARPLPEAAAPAAGTDTAAPGTSVSSRLIEWRDAWAQKDLTRYASFYAPTFAPAKGSRKSWYDSRVKVFRSPGALDITIGNIQRQTLSADLVETSFDQLLRGPKLNEKSRKTLQWKRSGTNWYIVKETGR